MSQFLAAADGSKLLERDRSWVGVGAGETLIAFEIAPGAKS